jgi:hypothetical protein
VPTSVDLAKPAKGHVAGGEVALHLSFFAMQMGTITNGARFRFRIIMRALFAAKGDILFEKISGVHAIEFYALSDFFRSRNVGH